MKCPKCGTEYNGNFCPSCGTQAQQPVQQPQAPKKKGLKSWQIVLIVIGSVVIGGAALILAFISAFTWGVVVPLTTIDTDASLVSAAPSDSTTDEASKNASTSWKKQFQMGDVIALDNFEITVTETSFTDRIDGKYNNYYSPDEGNKYLVVYMTIKNLGDTTESVFDVISFGDDLSAQVEYDGQYKYNGSVLISPVGNDLHGESIRPLSTVSGFLAFQLPDEAANSDKSLTIDLSLGLKSGAVVLR